MDREQLFHEIQRYSFTAVELNLYLDTHPTDAKALEMYQSIVDKLKDLTEKYEYNYGPLTAKGTNSGDHWTWIDGPWPWEM